MYFQMTMPMLDQSFQIPVSLLTPSSVGTISRKQINSFSSLSVMNLMSQYQERTTVSSTSLSSTSSSSSFQWFADKVRGWGRRYSNPNTANVCFTCSQVIHQVGLEIFQHYYDYIWTFFRQLQKHPELRETCNLLKILHNFNSHLYLYIRYL